MVVQIKTCSLCFGIPSFGLIVIIFFDLFLVFVLQLKLTFF